MVKGWLDHTIIIHSNSAVSHPCALVQLGLSSTEEQSALSSNTLLQQGFVERVILTIVME